MTHWPQTTGDVLYRVFLLRRLILTCAALIVAGLGAAHVLQDGASVWASSTGVIWTVALAVAFPALMAVLFPGAWIDHLAMALTAATSITAWPVIAGILGGFGELGLILLSPLAMILMTCAFMMLISLSYGRFPLGQQRVVSECSMPASAETVMDWAFPAPGKRSGRRIAGEVDENGVFPLSFGLVFPDPQNFTIPDPDATDAPSVDCHLRIIARGPYHQITQYIPSGEAVPALQGTSLVAREEVIPKGPDRCLYRCEEVHDTWDVVTWIAGWLNDQSRDYYVEMADAVRGLPTHAVRGLPQVTPMSLLAGAMTRWGLTSPKADAGG